MADLLAACCRLYGVSVPDLLGSFRVPGVMAARCAHAYALAAAGLAWDVVGGLIGRSPATAEALAAAAEASAREDGDAAADLAALCAAPRPLLLVLDRGAAWWIAGYALAGAVRREEA